MHVLFAISIFLCAQLLNYEQNKQGQAYIHFFSSDPYLCFFLIYSNMTDKSPTSIKSKFVPTSYCFGHTLYCVQPGLPCISKHMLNMG